MRWSCLRRPVRAVPPLFAAKLRLLPGLPSEHRTSPLLAHHCQVSRDKWRASKTRGGLPKLRLGSQPGCAVWAETQWQQLVFALWADASDRPRGSRTRGYVVTLATEELHGHGQEHDVSVMS